MYVSTFEVVFSTSKFMYSASFDILPAKFVTRRDKGKKPNLVPRAFLGGGAPREKTRGTRLKKTVILNHAHKTGSCYLLRVLFTISDEQPLPYYMGVPPPLPGLPIVS